MKKPFIQRKCWTRWLIYLSSIPFIIPPLCFAASDVGGKPEKTEIVVTYPQPSGSSTPLWVAYEAGLFKKYGLVASLQVLSPQASVQAVVSGSADFAGVGAELLSARLQGARLKVIAATLENLVFQMWGA